MRMAAVRNKRSFNAAASSRNAPKVFTRVVASLAVRVVAPLGVCAPGGSSVPIACPSAVSSLTYCTPNVVFRFSHASGLYVAVLPRSTVVLRRF